MSAEVLTLPRTQPSRHGRNLLELAALCPDRDWAASLICVCLKINERKTLARAELPEPDEWKAMPREQRLVEIGKWVTSECFALMDEE